MGTILFLSWLLMFGLGFWAGVRAAESNKNNK